MLKQLIAAMTRKPTTAQKPSAAHQPVSAKPPVATVPTGSILHVELTSADLVNLCLVASSLGIGYKAALSKLICDAKASLADPSSNATSRLIADLYRVNY